MKRLFAAAAFAPLCFAAMEAQAQTAINDARTTPIVTSTAGDITFGTAGSIEVKTGVPAVTIDSNNTLKATGPISVRDSTTGGTGVLVSTPAGGLTTTVDLSSNIAADDTQGNTDTDKDGDLDGPFVPAGMIRYGLRATGAGPVIGNITQTGGTIAVEGNGGSGGVVLETGLTGNLTLDGVVGVLGSDTYGVRLVGPVNGAINIGGGINAQGERAVGIQVEGPVSGIFRIDGTVNSFGYRYSSVDLLPVEQSKLDADDLLQSGSALRIMGDLGRGLLLDAPPADKDTTNPDEDNDGRPDAEEFAANIRTGGVAPALLIGHSTNAITISRTNDGEAPTYGLLINGQVVGNGIFDGFGGTGARIGGLGGAVNVEGGLRLRGQITGSGFNASANGLIIGAGASVPEVRLSASNASLTAGINTKEGIAPTARALVIEAGAIVPLLNNNAGGGGGGIRAGVNGPAGDSIAILDQSGTLRTINNSGGVSATVVSLDPAVEATGQTIAFDLRANTLGVNFNQTANTDTAVTPNIIGDVLFGTGAAPDVLNIAVGRNTGAVDFGGGADAFFIGETAVSRTELRKSAGTLDLDVQGDLTLTNTNQINASSLALGAKSLLTVTADPQNSSAADRATLLNVAGAATLASGSKIDLEFLSKLDGPTTFEVLRATALTNNGVDTSLVSDLPFVFTGAARVAANSVLVDVRPRTTTELGISGGRAALYDAFYGTFDADEGVAQAVFSKKNAADFGKLFDQFLPDYSGGPFNGLANATRAVYQAQGEKAQGLVPGEPRSWLQEVGVGTKFESVNDIEYQTGGFGVAGGLEKPYGDGNSAYGLSAAYVTSEIRNANRALGSNLSGSAIMTGVYWRGESHGVDLDASFSGGYAWFDSNRRVVDQQADGSQTLIRQANANWGGALAGARLGAAYDWEAGPFYVQHDALIDAIYLREGGYRETGGGAAVNLAVDSRDTYEVGAEVGVLIGARFGRSFRWGPEVRVAYRSDLASEGGETLGRFAANPNQSFILPGLLKDRNRVVVRAAIRGQGAYANFAFEASGDVGEIYQAYMARFMIRFLF